MAKKVGQRVRLSRHNEKLQRKQMRKNIRERQKRESRKRNKSYFKKKKKQIEKVIIKDSETLGYRTLKGHFDNLRPCFHSGERGRREMLKRYKGLRKNAATAVKNIEQFSGRKRKPGKKLREELSSGLCDICNVRMTRSTHIGRQPWHRETLEHVLDHNSGGSLKKSELAVICRACNQVLNNQKPKLSNYENLNEIYKKELYDFFIFKQVLLISHDAVVRDFNQQYVQFWKHRFNVANRNHRKGVDLIEDENTKSLQKETVYWSLDCFNHPHCRHCGACNSTSLSHDHGHNIPYFTD